MKIAVTGAAGFIGKRVVLLARAAGHEVVAIVRPAHDASELEAVGASIARADLGERGPESGASPLDGVLAGVDAIVHAAARVGWASGAVFQRDTVDATREVVAAASRAGVPRLVHVSSTAVYGDRAVERGPVTEDAPYGHKVGPWDRYALAKIEAEKVALAAAGHGIATVVVVRPGWVVGEGASSTASLVGLMGAPLYPLFGTGRNRLPVTYLDSVADACLRASSVSVDGPSRVYQIACDWSVSQRRFLEELGRGAGAKPRFLPVPFLVFFLGGWFLEAIAQLVPGFDPPLSRNVAVLMGRDADFPTTRAREELGWAPALPMEEAARRIGRSHATG